MNREQIEQLEEEYLEEHPGAAGTVELYVFDDLTNLENGMGNFPFLIITDNLLSEDWEATEKEWFVDSSGFGGPSEPALTIDQFRVGLIEYLQEYPDHGLALSGVGQFQVYVTAYRRK